MVSQALQVLQVSETCLCSSLAQLHCSCCGMHLPWASELSQACVYTPPLPAGTFPPTHVMEAGPSSKTRLQSHLPQDIFPGFPPLPLANQTCSTCTDLEVNYGGTWHFQCLTQTWTCRKTSQRTCDGQDTEVYKMGWSYPGKEVTSVPGRISL